MENELHALLQCTRHNEDRMKFLEVLDGKSIHEIQNAQDEEQLFITIMGCDDTEVLQALGSFVHKIASNRADWSYTYCLDYTDIM